MNCPNLAKSLSFGYSSSLSFLAASEMFYLPLNAFRSIAFLCPSYWAVFYSMSFWLDGDGAHL